MSMVYFLIQQRPFTLLWRVCVLKCRIRPARSGDRETCLAGEWSFARTFQHSRRNGDTVFFFRTRGEELSSDPARANLSIRLKQACGLMGMSGHVWVNHGGDGLGFPSIRLFDPRLLLAW